MVEKSLKNVEKHFLSFSLVKTLEQTNQLTFFKEYIEQIRFGILKYICLKVTLKSVLKTKLL